MTKHTTIRAAARLLSWGSLLLQAARRVTFIVAGLAATLALSACSPVAVTGPDIPGGLLGSEANTGEDTDGSGTANQDTEASEGDVEADGDATGSGWHGEGADLPPWTGEPPTDEPPIESPPPDGRRLPGPNDCYNASPPSPC
jgi:hypothetical protein